MTSFEDFKLLVVNPQIFMERQEFIDIINRELSETLTGSDIVTVIDEFCKTQPEYSKYARVVQFCIAQILQNDAWYKYYVYAKERLMVKYQVTSIYDVEKDVMTPVGLQKNRKLLRYM